MDIKSAAKIAFNNRKSLQASSQCGCYYCLTIFTPDKITEWTDEKQTAICPFCHVDSVIPDDIQELTKTILQETHNYWFKPKKDNLAKLSKK